MSSPTWAVSPCLFAVFTPEHDDCKPTLGTTPAAACCVLRAPQDVYHSLFGIGALLQAAEMAFQQNTELFSTAGFALVSGMELHARIINAWDAGRKEDMLPPGMKFYETSMPRPPTGAQW